MVHKGWSFGKSALVTSNPSGSRGFELPLFRREALAHSRRYLPVDMSNRDRER